MIAPGSLGRGRVTDTGQLLFAPGGFRRERGLGGGELPLAPRGVVCRGVACRLHVGELRLRGAETLFELRLHFAELVELARGRAREVERLLPFACVAFEHPQPLGEIAFRLLGRRNRGLRLRGPRLCGAVTLDRRGKLRLSRALGLTERFRFCSACPLGSLCLGPRVELLARRIPCGRGFATDPIELGGRFGARSSELFSRPGALIGERTLDLGQPGFCGRDRGVSIVHRLVERGQRLRLAVQSCLQLRT